MNIILGGGVAGLIWAYYHKDYFILTDQVGGQMMSYFDLGPRYLHNKTEAVPKFLESLNIPIRLSTIRVGYIDDGGWVYQPDLHFREKYFMKSRCQDNLIGFDPTVLNTSIEKFEVCDVDFKDLIFRLYDILENRIFLDGVKKIDLDSKLITTDSNTVFKFSKLVSTIPLKIFARIAGLNIALESFDMAYCLVSEDFFDLKEFDFVYVSSSNKTYHRMTKSKYGIVCDVFGTKVQQFIDETPKKYFTTPPNEAIKLVKNNQIISLKEDFELKDYPVKFVGRYGAWHRRWKTETVVEEAQNE